MAKKWSQKVKQLFVNSTDFPKDVMMDLPRITMIGQLHIYIENHRGLIAFTENEIRLQLSKGQLSIQGNAFVIKTILPEEILLEGVITSVSFVE
ncbi:MULTISPECIES: sporulation protein YqfC [Bacillus]|uniref:sporulation protein YqfC n=1 Tax=Bacillus TaxID=1386 RepID=UPI0002F2E222|nr:MULTISPECIES: sporulation protein YqfC [Bacillus]